MDRAKKFFSEAENNAITRAIKDAESNTSGEIAVMVVDRSDSYGEASALGAVALASIVALCLELAVSAALHYSNIWSGSESRLMSLIESSVGYASLWTFIPLAFLLYLPSRLIFTRFPVLSTFFMTRKRIHEAVRRRKPLRCGASSWMAGSSPAMTNVGFWRNEPKNLQKPTNAYSKPKDSQPSVNWQAWLGTTCEIP